MRRLALAGLLALAAMGAQADPPGDGDALRRSQPDAPEQPRAGPPGSGGAAGGRAWDPGAARAQSAEPAPPEGTATPLAPEAFRALAEGWTLHFERDGVPYGAESYGPGGAVLWRPEGGACRRGFWTPLNGAVCFSYGPERACWRLFRDAVGVFATPAEGGGPRLRVARRDRARLDCAEVPVA